MPYCGVHCLKFAIFAALSVSFSIITIQSTNWVAPPSFEAQVQFGRQLDPTLH